jgi:glutamyl-Q tRNA(Asp) synthetase
MIVTRFAPSPTGLLHLGHAFAAIKAFEAGERFILRIEDLDTTRCREEFVEAIFEDLRWLGIDWQEPVLRQSERAAAYQAALHKIDALGLTYPCFCTRKDIAAEIARASEAPSGPDGPIYPGTCRNLTQTERDARLASGVPHALRLDVTKAAEQVGSFTFQEQGQSIDGETGTIRVQPQLFGDIVLARKDLPASYHLAVVVDDAHQGVTLVTRGEDLYPATHVQRLLQALLGLPEPHYAHHKLILDDSGKKFSKRDKAITLRAIRENGWTPAQVRSSLPL